ncbi:peptide transporter [Lentzea sp. NBRC 105346]|uniref:peptide MFS transporter n=1 Tax=Lentzea sp. NBRC 105346 TaxID=3032205 RepID=UPI0024A04EAC|nr:oligopeptide:H+ symporter [Lentzea sp. NBRC 105346]GLZ36309.1 peptide transporter [Lentzea sp. NBRC 105346]
MTTSAEERVAEGVGRAPRRQWWFVTLFLTDVWERFGFFGLQAILALYAAAATEGGGLGLATADAAALAGSWIGLSYMLGAPGGWVGDRVLGVRRTMLLGAAVTTTGYLLMALSKPSISVVGLMVVAVGIGLYKPNHQTMVNLLYTDPQKRESGISMMYAGVQISALVAPFVVGSVGEIVSWRAGFLTAGAVMALSVVQVATATRQFNGVGEIPSRPLDAVGRAKTRKWTTIGVSALVVLTVLGALSGGLVMGFVMFFGLTSIVFPLVQYRMLIRHPELDDGDRRRLRTFRWVLLVWSMFFMIIAQGGSVLLLFAKEHTDRQVFGLTIPTSWFQSISPLFLCLLAPVFAWVLPKLGRGFAAVPVKFSTALLLGGTSFLLMSIPAAISASGAKVSPLWLFLVFFMHSCGEVIIIAVAVAAASDVLPKRFIGQTLGLLWLFAALGGGLGSQIVWIAQALPATVYYLSYGLLATGVGLLVTLRRKKIAHGLAT